MRTFDRALLAAYLRPEWRRATLLGLLLLVGIGFQLANPEIVNLFITRAEGRSSMGVLTVIGLLLLGAVLLAQAATVLETRLAEDLAWRTTNALRADLTRHVLDLDGSFHGRYSAGELIERIDGDVAAIATFFSRFVVQVLGNGVFLLGVLILLLVTDWRVGAVMVTCAALSALYLSLGGGAVAARSRLARQAAADLSGFLEERYEGLPDIKANGAGGYTALRLQERLVNRFRTTWASSRAAALFNGVVGVIFAVGMGGSLLLAAYLHTSGTVTLGSIYVIFRFSGMLQEPLEQLSQQINNLQQAAGGIVRVRQLLSTRSAVKGGSSVLHQSGPAPLAFENVSFDYGESPVLKDVSFAVRPGEILGLLGRTGSGKTTITRLVFRLHDPVSGIIRLDGRDIREASLESLRGRVGLVTQDVHLFGGTLRENVTLFDPSLPSQAVRRAFAELGLDGWLERQRLGLDTPVGSGGAGLSAGEAQLVALTRVFLKDPALVVLDEPTSRIDPVTARLINQGIERLLEGRSGIVIAHRLETVERVDTILILEDGVVAEFGSRADLAADSESRFSRLKRAGAAEVLA